MAKTSSDPETNINIAIIGDIILDHYIIGDCNRLSPEAVVPVLKVKQERFYLGGAANVLTNLRSLKGNAAIIGVCGRDDYTAEITQRIVNERPTFYEVIIDSNRKTTLKTRVVGNAQQIARYDIEDTHAIDQDIAATVFSTIEKYINDFQIVVFSDYGKGLLETELVQKIIRLCKLNEIFVIADSKGQGFKKFAFADILIPNKQEVIEVSGINIIDDQTLKIACEKFQQIVPCQSIIVKLSNEGLALFHENELKMVPAHNIELADITGVADTITAAIAFGIANKMNLYQACEFANQAASIVIAKSAISTPTLAEINASKNMDNE